MTRAWYVEDNYVPHSNRTTLAIPSKKLPISPQILQPGTHTTHILSAHSRPNRGRLCGQVANRLPIEWNDYRLLPMPFHWNGKCFHKTLLLNDIVPATNTYARCLANPICNNVCNGVNCCFAIRVGVWFFRGGNVAIVRPTKCNRTQQTHQIRRFDDKFRFYFW